MRRVLGVMTVALAAVIIAGCAATPAQHEYVTDYQVVGDRTVKYLYLPGESSRAGGPYLDQAIAVEICSIEQEPADLDDDDGEDVKRGEAFIETDCERTRLLKTEEYR